MKIIKNNPLQQGRCAATGHEGMQSPYKNFTFSIISLKKSHLEGKFEQVKCKVRFVSFSVTRQALRKIR